MTGTTVLQIFLLIDVFFIGVLAAIGGRHAYAHFRPGAHEPEKPPASQNGHLPPSVREKLLADAQANFQAVLERSSAELQHDLKETAADINKLVEKQSTEVIGAELERYRARLAELQKQTEASVGGAQNQLAEHQTELKAKLDARQAELEAKLAADIETEKQRLLQQIDTKLADAVGSFLTETLQHNVDLGAQSNYLVATLEAHKADFTREVGHETKA
jgi:hypothetical protein